MKSVVVTGAGAGIGKATAQRFFELGWRVGKFDIAGDDVVNVDVRDFDAVKCAVDEFAAGDASVSGGLDAFVNNAGVLVHGGFVDVDVVRLQRMVDVNVKGVMNGARAALPWLRKSSGTLVSMSSAAAVHGTPDIAVYAATKAFVSSLTEGLAIEESRRAKGDRARVVDVLPSFVDTDMVRVEQKGSRLVEKMGVRLTPDDVAAAIVAAVVERGGPIHRVLNLETRLQKALVGLSPRVGPWLVNLVERRR